MSIPPLTRPVLEKWIPIGLRRADEAGTRELLKFVNEVLQPVLNKYYDDLDRWARQIDVDEADSNTVDAILMDLGNPFEIAYTLPLPRRRLLVRSLVSSYKVKGTPKSITDLILALTGVVATIITPAVISGWELGVHVLGDQPTDPPPENPADTEYAVLGPSARFLRYSFQVQVDRVLVGTEATVITEIVHIVKPAHTHFVGIIQAGSISVVPDHWELGHSDLDDTTDLH